MTEKYTVKKWYDENAIYYKGEIFAIVDVRNQANRICDRLNELSTENEQLKKEYNKLKHRHSLLHDVCIEAECDRDSYHKDVLSLEKENEQLKNEVYDWKASAEDYLKLGQSLKKENEQLKKENKQLKCTIESNSQDDYIDFLEKHNEMLKERIEELVSNDKIVFMLNE